MPVVLGSEPVVLGSEPAALGSEPVALGSEPVVLGSEPAVLEPVALNLSAEVMELLNPKELTANEKAEISTKASQVLQNLQQAKTLREMWEEI